MSTINQDIVDLYKELNIRLMDNSLSDSEYNATLEAAEAIEGQALNSVMEVFRLGTAKFNEISTKLTAAASSISNSSLRKKIKALQKKLSDLHAAYHEPERETQPDPTDGNIDSTTNDDEIEKKPKPGSTPVVSSTGSIDGPLVANPNPSKSKKFNNLEKEYVSFFLGARFRSKNAQDETHRLCRAAANDRQRYADVSKATGVPWWFIAAIHLLESGRNFERHLHNGDRLTARTVNVPANRPANGTPPFTWEESAIDALKMKKFHERTDWSLARSLYRLEQYNGFGYRPKGIPTPYLWSLTTLYKRGKYASDGVFDANLVSKQCGAAAFIRGLVEIGQIEAHELIGLDAETGENDESGSVVIKPIPAEPSNPPVKSHAFKIFFEQNLPEITNFRWDEFLTKGASHSNKNSKAYGLNTDPPVELWPHMIPLAKALQAFRNEINAPVKLASVYRSPAYNRAISGAASQSFHMDFIAADIIAGKGTPKNWQAIAIDLRNKGVFKGGIGLYNTFLHIDVRGYTANWTG